MNLKLHNLTYTTVGETNRLTVAMVVRAPSVAVI